MTEVRGRCATPALIAAGEITDAKTVIRTAAGAPDRGADR